VKFFTIFILVALMSINVFCQEAEKNVEPDSAQLVGETFAEVNQALQDSNYTLATELMLDSLLFKFYLDVDQLSDYQLSIFMEVVDCQGQIRFDIALTERMIKLCIDAGDHLGATLFLGQGQKLMKQNNIDVNKEYPKWEEYRKQIRKLLKYSSED